MNKNENQKISPNTIEIMEEIRHKLKQNKPEITESSLKAYVLNLRKLHQRLHGSKDFSGLDWLQSALTISRPC